MNNTRPNLRDAAYIESGAWKCSKSPTGAHHWIITGGMMRCKYCNEKRVSTEVVRCRECEFDDKEHYAVVILNDDGDVEVRCNGGCLKCKCRPPHVPVD